MGMEDDGPGDRVPGKEKIPETAESGTREDDESIYGGSEEPETEEQEILPPKPMGPWFWAVMGMIGILILMILYGQVQGITHPIEVNLTGTSWTLASYADAQGTMVPVNESGGAGANLTFGPAGSAMLGGYSGCTGYSFAYERNATTVRLTQFSIRSDSCNTSVAGDASSLYLGDLANASGMRFRSGQLFISDSAGRPLLVLDLAGS